MKELKEENLVNRLEYLKLKYGKIYLKPSVPTKKRILAKHITSLDIDNFTGRISDVIAYLKDLEENYGDSFIEIDDSDEYYCEVELRNVTEESDEDFKKFVEESKERLELWELMQEEEDRKKFEELKNKYG